MVPIAVPIAHSLLSAIGRRCSPGGILLPLFDPAVSGGQHVGSSHAKLHSGPHPRSPSLADKPATRLSLNHQS